MAAANQDYEAILPTFFTENAIDKLKEKYDQNQISKIVDAKIIMKNAGLPDNHYSSRNNRSAWVLLALSNLKPGYNWSNAEARSLTTHEVRLFISDHYGMTYAPNSRESIRKETLHYFEQAQFIWRNSGDLGLATNSPDNSYSISTDFLDVLREYPNTSWEKKLADFNDNVPKLRECYQRNLDKHLIPITLPTGRTLKLSPGKHNQLHADIIHMFCARFVGKKGKLLYLGDTASSRKEGGKLMHLESNYLESLGVTPMSHDKLPDVVVYDEDRKWLFLIEAVTSNGPVSSKRWIELEEAFKDCTTGLIYVTAFPDKAELRKHVAKIAWETEVWVADNPDHMIHFNGDRFLGPHDKQ